MKRSVWVQGLLFGAFACRFAACGATTISAAEGVCTIDVPSGDVNISTLDLTKLTGNDLEKTGTGRLVIDTSLAERGWDGEFRIKAGYVRATVLGALGGTAKGTIVSDGATLENDSRTLGPNKLNLRTELVTISGKGVDLGGGKYAGALNNEYAQNYAAWGKIALAADAMVKSNTRTDFRDQTFDMNGHTLTVQGELGITSETIVNPGFIRIESNPGPVATTAGKLYMESKANFQGGDTNVLTFAAGASWVFQGASKPMPWAVVTEGGLSILAWSGADTNVNCIAGPMTLGGDLTFSFNPGFAVNVYGKVSGSGSVTTVNQSSGSRTVRFLNDANDYTGTTTVQGGYVLEFYDAGSLPGYATDGKVNASGGVIAAMVGGGNWTDAQLSDLFCHAKVTGKGGGAIAYLESGESYDFAMTGLGEAPISVGHGGEGSDFNLVGEIVKTNATLHNVSGRMNVAGARTLEVGSFAVAGGELNVLDGAKLQVTNKSYVGAPWPAVARTVVSNATLRSTPVKINGSADNKIELGYDANGSDYLRGILEVLDGGDAALRFDMGGRNLNMGSVFLRDGALLKNNSTGGGLDGYMGNSGGGYLEVGPGADYRGVGFFVVGSGVGGRAVVAQLGGSLRHENNGGQGIMTSSGSASGAAYSSLYFGGGTAYIKPDINICKCVWNEKGRNGLGSVDVAGDADVTLTEYLWIACHSNSVGTVSLKGGTLATKQFRKPTNGSQFRTGVDVPFTDNRAYVNLNGGAIRAMTDGPIFESNLDRVTLFSGGVTIDVTNRTVTLGHEVVAATDGGIASIPLPPAASEPWAYTGAPYVQIDGDGTGASAVALFDSVNGLLTNVVVTSPGVGYTTATATFSCGGWTNTVTVTPVLAANAAAGGLTVKGTTGKLTFGDGEMPLGAWLGLEGGTLEPGVASLTVKRLSGVGGTVKANVKVTDELVIDCAKMTPGCQYVIDGVLDLDGAKIRVVNLDASNVRFKLANFVRATGGITGRWTLDESVPDPWAVLQRGNTLTFHCARGLYLMIR